MPTELQERANVFLDANRVFSRAEFAEAINHADDWRDSEALLRRLVDSGRIKEFAPEVNVVAWDPESRGGLVVPDYLIASKLRPDGILGYHTALELCGIEYSVIISEAQILSCGPEAVADLPFSHCRLIRPHQPLIDEQRTDFLTTWKTVAEVPVRITAFEHTLVDVLHRPDRACGEDEVIECLNAAPFIVDELEFTKVADYVELVGIRSLAGVVGWWLERRRPELNVSDRTLDRMQAMLPETYTYALFARPERSELVPEWRIYLSPETQDTTFVGLSPDEEF